MKLKKLVPDNWIIKEKDDLMTLWFSSKRGNYNRKKFIFPKEIIIDENFSEAIGMVLGDGDMHRKEKRHLSYCSKDLDIAAFFLTFLRKRLLVKKKDIYIHIQHRTIKPDLKFISKRLNWNPSLIQTRFSNRHRYPVIHIQVSGIVFRLIFEKIVNDFLSSNFLENSQLRQGFLRGLFAAEGCVGIKYKEGYINQISFALAAKEKGLVNTLKDVLSKEKISFKTVERNNCIETIIQNWQNYFKCWNICLFDRCERKKKAFLSIAKNSKVYAVVSKKDLQKLAKTFHQKDLAGIIGSWQGNVSRMLKGNILFSLNQLNTLEQIGISLNIEKLRIGCLTKLPFSQESMNLFSAT